MVVNLSVAAARALPNALSNIATFGGQTPPLRRFDKTSTTSQGWVANGLTHPTSLLRSNRLLRGVDRAEKVALFGGLLRGGLGRFDRLLRGLHRLRLDGKSLVGFGLGGEHLIVLRFDRR